MEEGDIYISTWKRKGSKYILSLKMDSKIYVESKDFEDAIEELAMKICEIYGDGEAVIEFDRALPKSVFPLKYSKPEIVWVARNESGTLYSDPKDLFEGGICKLCKFPLGKRTKTPARVSLPSKSDGVIVEHIGPVFSEKFFSLLSAEELNGLELLKIEPHREPKRNFFEVVGKSICTFVGVKDYPFIDGRKCSYCGDKSFHYEKEIFRFLAKVDLPNPLPNCFVVGEKILCLCMKGERFRRILQKAGMRNIASTRLGIINNEEEIDRDPDVPLLKPPVRKLPP